MKTAAKQRLKVWTVGMVLCLYICMRLVIEGPEPFEDGGRLSQIAPYVAPFGVVMFGTFLVMDLRNVRRDGR